MKRALVAAAILMAISSEAGASYFSYSEWLNLSPASRATYIAGVFDTLTSYAPNEAAMATTTHFSKCFGSAGMTNGQLAENVIRFAQDKPNIQVLSPVAALIQYLVAACGKAP
jgi:hypothetical protein